MHIKIGDKAVFADLCKSKKAPIIYLNTTNGGSKQVIDIIRGRPHPDFSFVGIENLDWYHDMSPWKIPAVLGIKQVCTGGALDYMKMFVEEIIPSVESYLQHDISWRGLVGYSLAGLFSLYTFYYSDLFSRMASISGSFWYPEILSYVLGHNFKRKPEVMYFSLGDRESRDSKSIVKDVEKNTGIIYSVMSSNEIDTLYEINSGGHHDRAAERTANGILWLLGRFPHQNPI